jgi:hypothetical protein
MALGMGQKCKVFRQIYYGKLYTRHEKATVFEGEGKKTATLEVGGSLPLEEHFVRGKSKMIATLEAQCKNDHFV